MYSGKVTGLDPDWLCFTSFKCSACIISTNKSIAYVKSLITDNSVFITLTLEQGPIVLASVYAAPSGNLDADLSCWINYFTNCSRLLVCGDFNVPLNSLGYARENKRTEIYLEYLMISNLRLVNDPGAPHTYVQDDRKGRPDLTLAGLDVLPYLQNWMVDDTFYSFSDHKYICFKLNLNIVERKLIRYKTKNKSLKKFNRVFGVKYDLLSTSLERVTNVDALEDWMNNFNDYLIHVMNRCFKLGTITHKPSINWYTLELKIERNKVNALYKRHRRNLENDHYREAFISARRGYKRNLRKARKDGWTNFCRKTNEAYGNLYKYVSGKKFNPSDMAFSTLEKSEVFDDYDNVASLLMSEHFRVNEIPLEVHAHVSNRDFGSSPEFHPFTKRELKTVLYQQSNNKAPGYDNIDAIIVKNLCKTFSILMLNLYNTCLRFGHFPQAWKKGLIIFFRKRNRPANQPRSYRPISLLPILGKVYERLIKIRVITILESSYYFDDNQHGFREGRSTNTALESLKKMVKEKLQIFKYCAAVSFDISGAFDILDWSIVSHIIDDLPIYLYLKDILKNFISFRLIGFKFLTGIRWFRIFFGCPQGSCLGPLIWLLVADIILKRSRFLNMDLISYADDSIVVEGANTRSALEHKINEKVLAFATICGNHNLNINLEKTVAIMFGTRTLKKRRPLFRLYGRSIPVKDNIMYLGFKLDSLFDWLEHLDMIRSKVTYFTCNVRKTRVRDIGITLQYLKVWYLTVLKKQISYGHEVWFTDLRSHGLTRLSSCQRICLLSIVRSYRSVSTDALCVLAGAPPIHLEFSGSALKYRILKGDDSIEIDNLKIDASTLVRKIHSYEYPNYYEKHHINFINPVTRVVPRVNHPIIFTDGSKMLQGVSSAFTVTLKDNTIYEQRIKLRSFNTIYQAELVAISEAIDWCRSTEFNNFYLYTDSLSSYSAMQRLFPTDEILYKIFTNLRLMNNKMLHIGWVKAHVGITGNERADYLAKSVIQDDVYDKEIEISIPQSYLNLHIKKTLIKEWQSYWNKSTKGRDTFAIIRRVSLDYLCDSQISVYYITAHGSFPSFLHKIGRRENDRCNCGKRGDVRHFLFDKCPLIPYRFSFIRNRSIEWNIRNVVLANSNYDKLRKIYNQLNKYYSFIRYVF